MNVNSELNSILTEFEEGADSIGQFFRMIDNQLIPSEKKIQWTLHSKLQDTVDRFGISLLDAGILCGEAVASG